MSFIGAKAGIRPFFLMYAFPQTHVAVFSAPRNVGRSRRGAYGDAVEDIDEAVGRVMGAIRAARQEDNTLVVFTSDNGGWIEQETDGGSNGLLLGGKSQDVEGGLRVPAIVWGPGLGIRADYVAHALASTLDTFATALDYAGVPLPADRAIDGRSLRGVLSGAEDDAVSADTRFLFHYCGYELHAMRYGPWKAHFATPILSDPVAHTCTYVFSQWPSRPPSAAAAPTFSASAATRRFSTTLTSTRVSATCSTHHPRSCTGVYGGPGGTGCARAPMIHAAAAAAASAAARRAVRAILAPARLRRCASNESLIEG